MKFIVVLATALFIVPTALARSAKIVYECKGSLAGGIRVESWGCPKMFEENEFTAKNFPHIEGETEVYISNSYHLDQEIVKGVGRSGKETCLYSRLDHATNRIVEGTCIRVE